MFRLKEGIKTSLKLALGISIITFLLYRIGFSRIYETFLTIDLSYLPIILAYYLIAEFTGMLNFWILCVPLGLRFKKIIKPFFVSWALSFFIPGKLGELSIIYFLKDQLEMGKSSAVYLFNKFTSFCIIIVIAAIGILFFFKEKSLVYLTIATIALLAIFFLIALHPKSRYLIRRYILRGYAERFQGFSDTFFDYFRKYKKIVVLKYLLTLIKWLANTAVVYYIFVAFNQPISYFDVFLIHAVITTIGLIPITISGLGLKEGSAVFLYSLVGVGSVITLDAYLVQLVLYYAIAALILIPYILNKKGPAVAS